MLSQVWPLDEKAPRSPVPEEPDNYCSFDELRAAVGCLDMAHDEEWYNPTYREEEYASECKDKAMLKPLTAQPMAVGRHISVTTQRNVQMSLKKAVHDGLHNKYSTDLKYSVGILVVFLICITGS